MKKILFVLTTLAVPLAALAPIIAAPSFAATQSQKLGELSPMRTIIADTLTLLNSGDIKGAIKRITEYETAWDKNASRLKKLDAKAWKKLDAASDVALSTVRYPSATPEEMKRDVTDLLKLLDNPG